MTPLTDKKNNSYKMPKVCYIYEKGLSTVVMIIKSMIINSEIVAATQENIEELLIVFVI